MDFFADQAVTRRLRQDHTHIIKALFWSLAVLLRTMDIFVLFSRLRKFYVILIESFNDAVPFLYLVLYICFVFAIVSSFTQIGDL